MFNDYFLLDINVIVRPYVRLEGEIMKLKELDLLIGIIIGDGYIGKIPWTYQMIVGHGASQKDYCEWKMNLINEMGIFDTTLHMYTKDIMGKYIQYGFQKSSKKLEQLYLLFIEDGHKVIKNVLKYLKSNRSVAIWFMDDGSMEPSKRKQNDGTVKYYRPNMKLCTHSFSYEENVLIQKFFKNKYQIDCSIRKEIKRNRPGCPEYYFLRFNADNTEKVYRKILKEYIHCCKSMEYKFRHLLNYYENSNI